MADFNLTVGSRRPSLIATLRDANGPVNLTGSTVTLYMSTIEGVAKVTAAACTILSAADGRVQYDWASADTNTAGNYRLQFCVTSGGLAEFFPSGEYKYIDILPRA